MRITSPFAITLSVSEYRTLTELTRRHTAPARAVLRARIVLAAARRESNASIARDLRVHVDTVRKWRRRFAADRLAGLRDRPRPGRPRMFSAVQVAQVKALACEPPGRHELPLARWSATELATAAVRQRIVSSVSASTIGRWLAQDALKPWRYRSWIFPRDPDFTVKAGRVLDLYARRWAGRRLRPNEYVLSADEKTGVQALRRIHPGLPAGPGRPARVEFEYRRGGTLAYLAAYDVHQARVLGRCEPTTGITPFANLVEQVMRTEPYASARRVFWIVDNGSSHAGDRSVQRMRTAFPNARLIHLPVHASWLNQIEIYFSILQRKAITPCDTTDLDELAARLLAFEEHYNATAEPFDWTFTHAKLNALLDRLASHPDPCQHAA
ncbi:MAG TPA: IS630 family transposase [Mycobacteriales bacterium]